jgi:hypothetical protein
VGGQASRCPLEPQIGAATSRPPRAGLRSSVRRRRRSFLAISGRRRAYSAARAGTGRTDRSSASASGERPRWGLAPTWASQATLSRHCLKMRSFRASLRCASQPPITGTYPRNRTATCSWNIRGLDARYQRLLSKSGTEDGTAFSAVAPSWRLGRHPLIECVDGTSMKVDSSILRRLIRMRCWFEPLILRLKSMQRSPKTNRKSRLGDPHY